ncbi:TonB-dependent receptor [Sandaracinobacter sp. RS1-74]|uniref:TonB-dependent siderophore receptor n=1 Tax=Sandaracinobacteroides sayramensis TaxID=2913411 RepID=UPI001EDB82BA|nr:TonB-dependent receptor [Sandaracinobacteroides sayramensis]MCG2841294.1 TonB-dependent receptor [Sandaracinobacteroides sayramensis]
MSFTVCVRPRLLTFSRHLMLAGTALCLVTTNPAIAQTAPASSASARSFNIPAQPLRDALRQLMQQGSLQIGFEAADVDGKTSSPVSGSMSAGEALSRLLAGSGLTFRYLTAGSVVIERAPQSADGAIQLGPVRVEGEGGGSGYASIAPSITSDPDATENTRSFTTRIMSSATHLPLTMRETPQSVTVLTSARIAADNLVDLVDVAMATPGLRRASNDARPNFMSRGFAIDTLTQDGIVSEYIGDEDTLGNLAMQDRVEIVRGATGMMQGSGNPAGAINMIRKRPTSTWQFKGAASVGSWDDYRAMADVSGPLTKDGRVRIRLVGSFQDAGNYYDLAFNDKHLGYVTVDIDLTERTTLNIGYSHVYSNRNMSWGGLPTSYDGSHLDLPRSTFIGNEWEYDKNKADTFYLSLIHDFGADWKLSFNGARVKRSYDMLATWVVPTPDVGGYGHVWYKGVTSRRQIAGDLKLSGPVSLLGREHDLVIGGTFNRQTRSTDEWMEGWDAPLTSGVDPLTWNHAAPMPDVSSTSRWYSYYPRTPFEQISVYSAGRFGLAASLDLLLGARLDWFDRVQPGGTESYSVNGHLTKYAGLTWKFARQHSAYVSYTDVFQPQSLRGLDGNYLPPRAGENYEIGVKGEYLDGALNGSIALFRVEESNRPAYLTDQSGCTIAPQACFGAAGLVRSEGVDIELQGALAEGWQIGGGFTYSNVRYRKDANPVNIGKRLDATVPTTLFKLSTQYTLPGSLDRLTLGGRINWQSKMYWDEENAYGDIARNQQNAYLIADLSATYRLTDHLNVKLDVNNVFDKTYYSAIGYGGLYGASEMFGEPRNFLLTVSANF